MGGGGGDENLDILIEVLARDLETGGSTTNVESSRLDNLDGEGGEVPTQDSDTRLTGKFVSSNVLNLSKRVLSKSEISMLSKGLNFCTTPKELDKSQLKRDLEDFGRRLRLKWAFRDSEPGFGNTLNQFRPPSTYNPRNIDASIEVYLSKLEDEILNLSAHGSNYSNLTVDEQEALRDLSRDRTVIIKGADKGSAVVVWDRDDYLKEAGNHLGDTETYEKVENDPFPDLIQLVSNSLCELKRKGEIDEKMREFLSVTEPRLGRFYLLPKVHKRLTNVPGRPVISNCGYLTENISSFLDFHLQPLARKVKSFVKDTNDFLCKIRDLPPLPEKALLCSIDVVSLYPSIPNEEGLQAMREALDKRGDKSVSTDSLVDLAEIVLKNNFFEFGSDTFVQRKGTAIGTKFAPPYAIVYLGKFEEEALEGYHLKPWIWNRFLDDIFLIWEHGETEFLKFMEYLNSIHPNIKFTYKISTECVEFLDVLVRRDGDTLSTDLYVKDTDTHQFLHFDSCHPFHTKRGIPYGQALRIRRICSKDDFFERRMVDLKQWLISRGYQREMVDTQIDKARLYDRDTLLSEVRPRMQSSDKVFLVITYHPALSKRIYDILKSNQNILQSNAEHKKVFGSLPIVSFRRAKTIKDVLVRSKLMEREFEPGSCQTCTRRNCLVNNFLDTSEHFTNAEGDRRYNLRKGHLHCNSKFVVYKIRCKTCNKQYVGSTITKFRERFNNYKSQFRKYSRLKESGCQNPGKDISQARFFEHFLSNDHGGMDDWSFQIIDQADTRKGFG